MKQEAAALASALAESEESSPVRPVRRFSMLSVLSEVVEEFREKDVIEAERLQENANEAKRLLEKDAKEPEKLQGDGVESNRDGDVPRFRVVADELPAFAHAAHAPRRSADDTGADCAAPDHARLKRNRTDLDRASSTSSTVPMDGEMPQPPKLRKLLATELGPVEQSSVSRDMDDCEFLS